MCWQAACNNSLTPSPRLPKRTPINPCSHAHTVKPPAPPHWAKEMANVAYRLHRQLTQFNHVELLGKNKRCGW